MNWKIWIAVTGTALIVGCSSDRLRDFEAPETSEPARRTHSPTPTEATQETSGGERDPQTALVTSDGPSIGEALELPGGRPDVYLSQWTRTEAPPLPPETATQQFSIRIRGDNAQGATSLLFNVRRLRAVANGLELPVMLEDDTVDLANDASALARVMVPKDAKEVSFLLELDGFGGYERPGEGAVVDVRAVPIEWTSELSWLQHRGHTVLHIDVAKSLVPTRDGYRLLPEIQIRH